MYAAIGSILATVLPIVASYMQNSGFPQTGAQWGALGVSILTTLGLFHAQSPMSKTTTEVAAPQLTR